MTAPRLSVALPVRNGANYLAEALDSILAQDFADFELVVSDNASTDATPDILADYAARDARVKPSRSTEPLGQAENMTRAVRLAGGSWVKLFCHDDLMRGDCLAQVDAAIAAVDGSATALIGNGERHLFANGYRTEAIADAPPARVAGRGAIVGWLAGTGVPLPSITTATVRRSAFEAMGGFDPRYVHFDTFGWIDLLGMHDYAYLPASLTTNRIHGRQVAADARVSLRSVDDHRRFVAELLGREGLRDLSGKVRWRGRMKPLGVAAVAIASELARGRRRLAAGMVGRLPPAWLPLIGPLVLRALAREQRRLREVRRHVPHDMIYP